MTFIDAMWFLVYVLSGASLVAGSLIWFILPKKWIAWSKTAGELLPQETVPPWRSLNKLGKTLYLIFIGSAGLLITVSLIGALLE